MFSVQVTLKDRVVDEDIVAILISKVMMRVLGALLRMFFIIVGCVGVALVFLGMVIAIVIWTFLPVLLLIMGYFLIHFSM
jgi:hypothetical protein